MSYIHIWYMLCYSDIDAKIIVTDICFQEVAAVHVACIVIAIYWCTYFYIESTGMLFPPKPTTPHPLHDWAHCHLCIFSLGSAQVQPINNKSIYGVIACLYKQNNTQHAKDKRYPSMSRWNGKETNFIWGTSSILSKCD